MGISRQEALDCLLSDDLLGIGMEADALRRRLHPEEVVTYQAVYEMDGSAAALSIPESVEAVRVRCSNVARVAAIADVCLSQRSGPQSIWLEVALCPEAASDPAVVDAIPLWMASGINSITVDLRRSSADYARTGSASLELYRVIHALGMRTSLGIPFGGGESYEARIDLLDGVRNLQDELGGFITVVPLAIDPPEGRELDGCTAVERLKMLAVARMYLDTIEHVQSPQVGSGLKVLQMGLRFGANDAELRQFHPDVTEQALRRVIRDAGLTPVERNAAYTTVFLS